ncbi:CMF_collapsed_G0013420.mRNA.1.CDS.1 [Saccharomyces cerevisiae]|nr:CMF_collapsed_G0013420.mRNA.1.CDS.1 [Saccharomyces cerevisiae]
MYYIMMIVFQKIKVLCICHSMFMHFSILVSSLNFFATPSLTSVTSVRIWENQINVPIKQISDTAQHSMPFLNVHPSQNYFCAQSMDNRIYSFSLKPKYKRHPKKIFKGHSSAGYGISLAFSGDGR